MFRKGLLPPRPGAVKMVFGDYLPPVVPKRPAEFGHAELVSDYHMLGNDSVGCCAWSGAAHETFLWTAMAGERAHITTVDVLSDYGACTGYQIGVPSTDQGTDMQAAASYRQKIGIRDANGARHKVGAYAAIKPGDFDQALTAAWLLGAIGLGVVVGQNQENQFRDNQPWDGDPGANSGGHYVPYVGRRNGFNWVISWGRLVPVTDAFLENHCDQALAYVSPDALKNGLSMEGFNMGQLQDDLRTLTT